MSRIAVIGTGYVGLTTGACFAHLGHRVICADVVPEKVERLSRGDVPILEAGLDDLVREGIDGGRLSFVLGATNAVADCEFAYLCVPTPQGDDGSADLSYIEGAAAEIGPVLPTEAVVVNKSTVPVGSTRVVERALGREDVSVVSNPEFLREGSAVHDFLHPDRIVIGSDDQAAAIRVASLFSAIQAPLIVTDPASAETIKYASNAFLAAKVSYVNAIANVCEAVGADVREVVLGMGYDKRIGFEFLKPGPGWGGSCLVGDETVLVRREGNVRLLSLEDLFREVRGVGPSGWDVLAWRPEDPTPEFLPVAAFTARPHTGEVVELRTKMGRRVTCTPDHPFIVGDGVEPMPTGVKLASDLTDADWLPVAQGSPLHTGPVLHELDVTDGHLGTTTNGTYVPAAVAVDEDFWRVIGLYLAERSRNIDGARHRLKWTFHPRDEMELVDFVAGFWQRLGVKVAITHPLTACCVSVSSRLLSAWFTDVLRLGSRSYDKRVPELVWTAPESHKRALLRGLWDGDGSWSYVAGGPSVVLEYGTVSRPLADGIMRLLCDLGVMARLKVGRTAKSTVDTHWITIAGADQVEDCLFLLPEDERRAVRRSVDGQAKRIRPTGYRPLSKNASWVRVVDKKSRAFEGLVYSMEVPGAHSFVTSHGLVVDNCFPKDTRALIRIAEDAGYDFGLLRGVIEVNDEQYERVAQKVERMAGGSLDGVTVAVWGLTFKARTDDLRDSPSLEVIKLLRDRGASIQAYDPAVPRALEGIDVRADPYAACEGAAVLAVLTEWDEFRWVDFDKVRDALDAPRIVDARNLLDPAAVRRRGFSYVAIGRT